MSEVGTKENPLRVAVVGAGPTGFYTAEHLFKRKDLVVEVDMFDSLPTPFGLVRAGVAPDHQKIKSVTKLYTRIAQNGGPARLVRNDQALGHHWLRIHLRGNGSSVNRDAIGAWVEIFSDGETQRRQVMPTRSFLSQVELPVTFGLGSAARIDALRIRWPDGSLQELTPPAVDQLLVLEQP